VIRIFISSKKPDQADLSQIPINPSSVPGGLPLHSGGSVWLTWTYALTDGAAVKLQMHEEEHLTARLAGEADDVWAA